ncbi:hypothetical protein Pcinc_000683 [Petrolisthes cinctipes]|uniref:Uncharacterized protein n=1 Tax=Petrolisthes cinctipes TaxID=88211 RepID=A0AAE1GPG5_PETCI|nr:hypothetical protein Pcinc_000683 [Petrolisthes cinctipes]
MPWCEGKQSTLLLRENNSSDIGVQVVACHKRGDEAAANRTAEAKISCFQVPKLKQHTGFAQQYTNTRVKEQQNIITQQYTKTTEKQVPGLEHQNKTTQQFNNTTGKRRVPPFEAPGLEQQNFIIQRYTNTTREQQPYNITQQYTNTTAMANVTRKQVPGISPQNRITQQYINTTGKQQQKSITQQYMNITGKQKIPHFEMQTDITQQYTNTTGKQKIHHFEQQKSITQQYNTNKTGTSGSSCMNVAMTFPYHPSPRKTLIQGVVLRQTNKAFRSHRLFPLLKDLAITDHYYRKNVFSVAPLISYLPESTDELVSLYLKRHPKSTSSHESDWHSPALDAVVLDAVKYAHRSLVGQY